MRCEECGPRAGQELRNGAFWRDVFAEFLATYFLVAAQCMLQLGYPDEGTLKIGNAIGMGMAVLAIGWTFTDFSGAHMNPAVTLTLMLRLKVTFVRGIVYWIVQCAAGIAAAFTVKGLESGTLIATSPTSLALTTPRNDIVNWKAMLIEMIATCILCLTVHGATNIKRKGALYINTFPIGMAVTVGLLMTYSATGGSLNPARSLGPAVALMNNHDDVWNDHWVYWAGPFLGAIVAAILYTICNVVYHPDDQVATVVNGGTLTKDNSIQYAANTSTRPTHYACANPYGM